MNKSITLVFVLVLTASSLIMVKPTFAQIPTPSVPEFTIKYVPASHTVTAIDPYTGQNVTQQYDNNTVELSFTNQRYTYSNGTSFYVYLNVRTKGHFEENWTELYPIVWLLPNSEAYQHSNYKDYYAEYVAFTAENSRNDYPGLPQSDSTYTIISLPAPASKGQVDFQTEAMIGHNSTAYDPTNDIIYDPESGGVNRPAIAYDASSGWSITQTITIPDTSTPSPTPTQTQSPSPILTPTPSPSIPESPSWMIGLFAIGASAFLLMVRKRVKKA